MERRPLVLLSGLFAATVLLAPTRVHASDFDELGKLLPAEDAAAFDSYEAQLPEIFVPEDENPACASPKVSLETREDALDGSQVVSLDTTSFCTARLMFALPRVTASYVARVWMRHGSVAARITATYPEGSPRALLAARMFPTGRTTSDGWVELASNPFTIYGEEYERVYLRASSYATTKPVELDAMELVESGEIVAASTCTSAGDACTGGVCALGQCILGGPLLPPLPDESLRDDVVTVLKSRLSLFFGGHRSRTENLPVALSTMESMRGATTPWDFWNAWGTAIRRLGDWHTRAESALLEGTPSPKQLKACFIEGDADLSHQLWPSDLAYPDILVSHVGTENTMGLNAGDRLVAVDGQHPIAWALSLVERDWNHWRATDPTVYADLVESLAGGGGRILRYASTITVIRCPDGVCTAPEVLNVADFPVRDGRGVGCDNRPIHRIEGTEGNHRLGGNVYVSPITNTLPEEQIYGMMWDSLSGGGDPNGPINLAIRDAFSLFRSEARGVILDHRAGNGGTLDAAEGATALVRPPETVAVVRMPIAVAGDDGPANPQEGKALFEAFKSVVPFTVGSDDYDPTLPVAVVLHRDGSASDYFPFGIKGAPLARIFAPHPTAGAFSTYINFEYWGGLSWQMASGDTISSSGQPLIGHGVVPDYIVAQKQSDLVQGIDTLFEAALTWVRSELKP